MALHDLDYVLHKLRWMETNHIWPNGLIHCAFVVHGRGRATEGTLSP